MDELEGFPPVACDAIGALFTAENGIAYVLQWLEDVLDEGLGAYCWVPIGRV